MKSRDSEGLLTDTGVTAPERSLAQRLDALQRANVVRTERAQLKRDLKSGRVAIQTLLLDPPACMITAKVFDILLAVPKYGRVKANRTLRDCRISPSKTMGGLSARQRLDLATLLRSDAEPSPAQADRFAASEVTSETEHPELESKWVDEELMRRLERVLEEARQAGRLAGQLAHEAGAVLDASAPKPDSAGLQAAVAQALRPSDSAA